MMDLVCIYLSLLRIYKLYWAIVEVFSQSVPFKLKVSELVTVLLPVSLHMHLKTCFILFSLNYSFQVFSMPAQVTIVAEHVCFQRGCSSRTDMLSDLKDITGKCCWMSWFLPCHIIRPHQQLRLFWLSQALSTAGMAVMPKLCKLSSSYILLYSPFPFFFPPVSSPSLTYSISSTYLAAATWAGALMNLRNGLIKDKVLYPCRALCQGLTWSWLAI